MSPRTLAQALILLLSPSVALAYVDPGSGMLMWQGLIAAVGVGVVFFRHPWKTIKELLHRFTKRR